MNIRVKATSRGYFKRLIDPPQEFEIEKASQLGSWMEVLDKKAFKLSKKKEAEEDRKTRKKELEELSNLEDGGGNPEDTQEGDGPGSSNE